MNQLTSADPCLSAKFYHAETILESLEIHAQATPDATALIFLSDGEVEEPAISYGELLEKVRNFAAGLTQVVKPEDRVILLFQSSYEFIITFLGCLYAGVVPVPMPIPSRRISEWMRIEGVQKNCAAKLTIMTEKTMERLLHQIDSGYNPSGLSFCSFETLMQNNRQDVTFGKVFADQISFLQYTSGSTGAPKGVTLTHRNLMENQKLLFNGMKNNGTCVYVSWLPLFHDMGLIGNFLQAIYIGQPFIFMAPNAFLQKPARWLKAISKYKARVSGAPNFAYQLCAEKIKDMDKEGLDLSSWQVAFNGAEPIRASTLKLFSEAFKSVGFAESAFFPCYGTAESTLIISGADCHQPPFYLNVDLAAYEKNLIVPVPSGEANSIELVSSGIPLYKNSVAIVDPETKTELPPLHVGEIWISSPCNAIGYWNNQDATIDSFKNKIIGSSAEYLNTGDLGFSTGSELFITGRSKDLLIFNGRNIYPQDIEACSESASLELRPGRCAAVSLYHQNKEKLILIHEVERTFSRKIDVDEIVEKIRILIHQQFSLTIFAVALVSPSTIPMTSSGKIRRQMCKQQYLSNELKFLAHWNSEQGFVNHTTEKA